MEVEQQMEMKLNKLFFYMLQKEPQKTEKEKEVYLYDEMDLGIEKLREYMASGVPAESIELAKLTLTQDGLKAEVVAWSTIAEALVKKSTKVSK
jgi:hypothetical protein